MRLARINSTSLQNISNSYEKLIKWAAPKGLLSNPDAKMVTVYHDSAKTTAFEKVRTSACLIVTDSIEPECEIELKILKPGRCIVSSVVIGMMEFEQAWKELYIWKNKNKHKISSENPFEIYHNNYQEHPEKKCMVDFCIPIK